MSKLLSAVALLVAAWVLPSMKASAATLNVLTAFNGTNGANPYGSLIADSAGNFYGTTSNGGAYSLGTVFELTPPAAGQTAWTETVLFSFNGANGSSPIGSLIADNAGNLYGTTQAGGTNDDGTVFELTPPAAGQTAWTEAVLFSFSNYPNGYRLSGSLIADSVGNLYGTAATGGTNHGGTVFELMPPAAGQTAWTNIVLFNFTFSGPHDADPSYPSGSLIADNAGNLYGTTQSGGAGYDGTVFELTPPAPGQTAWTATVLVNFNWTNGAFPYGSLIFDSAGSLYGTTRGGGASGQGTVFELTPPAAGQTVWTEAILTSFKAKKGRYPVGSLIADSAGNLYGTTSYGGADEDNGTVFELKKPVGHKTAWKEKVLTSFDGTDGIAPNGSLIFDSAGNLYGTTSGGGQSGDGRGQLGNGAVFELTP